MVAADAQAEDYINRLEPGEAVLCRVVRARNPAFHRKFWAVADFAYQNQEKYPSKEALVTAAKLCAGCVNNIVVDDTGRVGYTLKSLSWADMDEDEFAEWYPKLLDAMETLTGIPAHTLDQGYEVP